MNVPSSEHTHAAWHGQFVKAEAGKWNAVLKATGITID